MGYTTDFNGQFDLDKPLAPEHLAYLKAFNETRRMSRKADVAETFPDPIRIAAGLPIGPGGAYYVGAFGRDHGQVRDESIIDYNDSPEGQPGLWCQWTPDESGEAIIWDEGEKFYDYVEWLQYLIENFLKPWGYHVNGSVTWTGEDNDDRGTITVIDNEVSTRTQDDVEESESKLRAFVEKIAAMDSVNSNTFAALVKEVKGLL